MSLILLEKNYLVCLGGRTFQPHTETDGSSDTSWCLKTFQHLNLVDSSLQHDHL